MRYEIISAIKEIYTFWPPRCHHPPFFSLTRCASVLTIFPLLSELASLPCLHSPPEPIFVSLCCSIFIFSLLPKGFSHFSFCRGFERLEWYQKPPTNSFSSSLCSSFLPPHQYLFTHLLRCLMYLQEPIPIVIPPYDLRLRHFDRRIPPRAVSFTRLYQYHYNVSYWGIHKIMVILFSITWLFKHSRVNHTSVISIGPCVLPESLDPHDD